MAFTKNPWLVELVPSCKLVFWLKTRTTQQYKNLVFSQKFYWSGEIFQKCDNSLWGAFHEHYEILAENAISKAANLTQSLRTDSVITVLNYRTICKRKAEIIANNWSLRCRIFAEIQLSKQNVVTLYKSTIIGKMSEGVYIV